MGEMIRYDYNRDKLKIRRKYVFNKDIIIFLVIIAVVVGKVARWNFSGGLTDRSIGRGFLNEILYGDTKFSLWDLDETSNSAGGNAVFLFRAINVFRLTTFEQFEIYVSIIGNLLLSYYISISKRYWSILNVTFILLLTLILNIFALTLSKEPIQMLTFLALYFVFSRQKNTDKSIRISVIVVYFLSCVLFRSYFIFAVFYFIALELSSFVFKEKKYRILLTIILLIVSSYIMLQLMEIVSPSTYAKLFNLRSNTRAAKWNTGLTNIFSGLSRNPLLLTFDYVQIFIRLFFPFEILVKSTRTALIMNVALLIYRLILTYILIKFSKTTSSSSKNSICLNTYLAFVFTSVLFEPDMGSWARHESVAFPLLLLIAGIVEQKRT